MADSRAYVYNIKPNASSPDETAAGVGVHQTSPAWVLTFVRWANRDTLRTTSVASTDVRGQPLVVENDCIQVSTTMNKGTQTPSMSAVLVMTDVNYETAIAPGDFVIVNMLNWEKDQRRVADAARAGSAINGFTDGFKGLFKVQAVRKMLSVAPDGTKTILFKVTGFAFTEFNNTIYFNPYLLDPNQDPKNALLFSSYIGKDWQNLINQKGLTNCQDLISVLISSFIGSGIGDNGLNDKDGNVISPNVHFYMPAEVGRYLGAKNVKAAADIYNYLFGIQHYAHTASTIASAFNPIGTVAKTNRFYYTGDSNKIAGDSFLKPEYWNQVKAWSILNQYTNAPLNEIYTCFRVGPNGRVMPTLVLRQIPFTTEDFNTVALEGGPASTLANVTRFLNLPRWKVDPSLITDLDIGREEAARVNFVQFFGKSTVSSKGTEISQEIAQGNYVYDIGDVQRAGLRPYIVTTQFDEPTDTYKEYRSPTWAKILGDALIGGHLKLNGSITCVGIVEPITVGDNFELDGTVFHIESVTHTSTILGQNGNKSFRTTLALSSGVSKSSSTAGTRYSEMTYTSAYDLRNNDYTYNKLLPGVSESQDTVYRSQNPDVNDSGEETDNGPFAQPNTISGASKPKKTPGDTT